MRWATRLNQLAVQLSLLVALGGVIGALFVVPRVELHPPVNKTPELATIVSRGDETVIYDLVVDGKAYRNSGMYYGTSTVGDPLRVWYDPRDPSRATTVPDQPAYDYGKGSLLVLAFPGGAIAIALLFMWHRRRFRLLRYGRAVEATLRASDPTPGNRVAYLRFRYVIEGTEHTASLTTVRRDDGQTTETVLYDPADPSHACALADLTCRPRLDGDAFVPTRLPYLAFALPLATLAMVGVLVAKSL